jgi:hypothetical protein
MYPVIAITIKPIEDIAGRITKTKIPNHLSQLAKV